MTLNNFCLVIGKRFDPISGNLCLSVLDHCFSIPVVDIYEGESILAQFVKELLFSFYIFLKCFMVIEVIVGYIGENRTCKMQARYPMLCSSMRAYFHKCIFTTCVSHFFP